MASFLQLLLAWLGGCGCAGRLVPPSQGTKAGSLRGNPSQRWERPLLRSRRSWVWNQFFVIEEYAGPEPVLIGRVSPSMPEPHTLDWRAGGGSQHRQTLPPPPAMVLKGGAACTLQWCCSLVLCPPLAQGISIVSDGETQEALIDQYCLIYLSVCLPACIYIYILTHI